LIVWILTLRDFLETQTNEENSEGAKIIERKRRWAKRGLPKRFWIYIPKAIRLLGGRKRFPPKKASETLCSLFLEMTN
jgi:hypothetical protein